MQDQNGCSLDKQLLALAESEMCKKVLNSKHI